MTLEEVSHLGEIDGLGAFLRKRHVDIAMDQNDQTSLRCKIQKSIQRRIRKAGGFSRDF